MKKHAILVAAAALSVSAAASAGTYNPALDHVISLNDGETFNVTNVATVFSVNVPVNGTVTGFSFEGTLFVNQQAFPGSPSQTQLTITAPDSSTYVVGGNPPSGSPWDFQSAIGTLNVTYNHGIGGEAWGGDGLPDFGLSDGDANGMWQFSFLRVGGFPSTSEWSDVSITLHMVPAPGALAMFGIALAGGRRRRRA